MGSNVDGEIIAANEATRARSGGIRERIPALGLTEYWYPALRASKVGRGFASKRPTPVTIAGQTIVFFHDENDHVVALSNLCPHRGAYLSHGTTHFKGTLTCPYHGWTFDAKGNCLAALGEGPESEVPGTRGTQARSYPTQTLMGVVFVWMGQGKPAPIEEDVPPELFSDRFMVMTGENVWQANWRPSIENFSDSHVYYVHRNSLEMLTQPTAGLLALAHSGPTRPEMKRINDRALVYDPKTSTVLNYTDRAAGEKPKDAVGQQALKRAFQDTYPALGGAKWPPTNLRYRLSQLCGFFRGLFKPAPAMQTPASEWGSGVHLPCIVRVDYRRIMFTRFEVPIDAQRTNNFYFIAVRRGNALNQLFWQVYFQVYFRWKTVVNFSAQDAHMAEITDYDAPERLTPSDKFPREWRRFVVDCARKPSPD